VFLDRVLSKKYTNPSSDIIEVLAGLDNVDPVFTDLVTTLDNAMKSGKSGALYLAHKTHVLLLIFHSHSTLKGSPGRPMYNFWSLSDRLANLFHATRSFPIPYEGELTLRTSR